MLRTWAEPLCGKTSAPTTLPAHLLAHLTAPSARAIVVVIENFDLFTNHARQALLYCLRKWPDSLFRLGLITDMQWTSFKVCGRDLLPRRVAVWLSLALPAGWSVSHRAIVLCADSVLQDTTLLLEKRVKSRFSQRIYRVVSPLSINAPDAWRVVARQALVPEAVISQIELSAVDRMWLTQWESQVDVSRFWSGVIRADTMLQAVLGDEDVEKAARRICELSTDVRILLRPFVSDTSGLVTHC